MKNWINVLTCALCRKEEHPANYKGCEIYQEKIKAQEPKQKTVV